MRKYLFLLFLLFSMNASADELTIVDLDDVIRIKGNFIGSNKLSITFACNPLHRAEPSAVILFREDGIGEEIVGEYKGVCEYQFTVPQVGRWKIKPIADVQDKVRLVQILD